MLNYLKREERAPIDTQIEHIAVTFVVDVSASMNDRTPHGKTAIELLNSGLNELIQSLGGSDKHKDIVDLSIITFGERGREEVYQPFAPIGTIKVRQPINLIANHGSTYAANALEMAIENTRERVKLYKGGMWAPWIIFMTDGFLHDDISVIAKRSREREAQDKLRTFAIGIGEKYDKNKLKQLSDKAYEITEYKLEEFLQWVGNSIGIVSESVPGTQVTLPSNQDPNNPGQTIFTPTMKA